MKTKQAKIMWRAGLSGDEWWVACESCALQPLGGALPQHAMHAQLRERFIAWAAECGVGGSVAVLTETAYGPEVECVRVDDPAMSEVERLRLELAAAQRDLTVLRQDLGREQRTVRVLKAALDNAEAKLDAIQTIVGTAVYKTAE